jgi:hypothetical protein
MARWRTPCNGTASSLLFRAVASSPNLRALTVAEIASRQGSASYFQLGTEVLVLCAKREVATADVSKVKHVRRHPSQSGISPGRVGNTAQDRQNADSVFVPDDYNLMARNWQLLGCICGCSTRSPPVHCPAASPGKDQSIRLARHPVLCKKIGVNHLLSTRWQTRPRLWRRICFSFFPLQPRAGHLHKQRQECAIW